MKAIYATLLDHFKLTIPQIAQLTDRQIHELYFHARDDQGVIRPERQKIQVRTPEEEARALEQLATYLGPWGGVPNLNEILAQAREQENHG